MGGSTHVIFAVACDWDIFLQPCAIRERMNAVMQQPYSTAGQKTKQCQSAGTVGMACSWLIRRHKHGLVSRVSKKQAQLPCFVPPGS
jgi:hypothetical protein